MAKIFSWALKDNANQITGYAYLSEKVGNAWDKGYTLVKPDAKIDDSGELKLISARVASYTSDEYDKTFNSMVEEIYSGS